MRIPVIGRPRAGLGDLVPGLETASREGEWGFRLLDAATLECETGLVLRPVSGSPDGDGWHGNAYWSGRAP